MKRHLSEEPAPHLADAAFMHGDHTGLVHIADIHCILRRQRIVPVHRDHPWVVVQQHHLKAVPRNGIYELVAGHDEVDVIVHEFVQKLPVFVLQAVDAGHAVLIQELTDHRTQQDVLVDSEAHLYRSHHAALHILRLHHGKAVFLEDRRNADIELPPRVGQLH